LGERKLISVAPEDAANLREVAALLFAGVPVCSGGKYNVFSIMEAVQAGRSQLWLLIEEDSETPFVGAAVTEIFIHPGHRTLRLWMAGGDFMGLVKDGGPTFDAFAEAEGCSNVEVDGPDFIIPFLARHGFKLASVTMSRKIPFVKED
jgi:hypothetical protein